MISRLREGAECPAIGKKEGGVPKGSEILVPYNMMYIIVMVAIMERIQIDPKAYRDHYYEDGRIEYPIPHIRILSKKRGAFKPPTNFSCQNNL